MTPRADRSRRACRLRRWVIGALLFPGLTLCVLLGMFVWGCMGRGPSRPNVVLITIDTLRADHLGCYGDSRAATPRIDAFAREAVLFRRAVSTATTTLASHAAILSGHFPREIGVPRNSFPVPEDVPLLAQRLQAEGYATAAFVSCAALHSSLGLDRGFDLYDEAFTEEEVDQRQRRAEATTRAVLGWLAQPPPEPYFLWVHYFDPHYPYTPPAPFDTLFGGDYDGPANGSMDYLLRLWSEDPTLPEPGPDGLQRLVDLYDGEIAYLDTWLAPLFAAFASPEARAGTLVVFTADHGESLTEHEYYFHHGREVYQPSIHVPLIMRLPGDLGTAPGSIDVPVQTHWVTPTVLSLLGIEAFPGTAGRDLLPLLRGERAGAAPELFAEASQPWVLETEDAERYQNDGKSQTVAAYPWKLIVTPHEQATELYDLERDPGELTNLAGRHHEQVARLNEALGRWRAGPTRIGRHLDPASLERLRSLGYIQ